MPQTKSIATIEQIQKIAKQIAEKFRPQRIILFGSYARGNPTPESDVDLLVVMDVGEEDINQVRSQIYESFDSPLWSGESFLPVRLEVHIMKPDEFEGSLLRRGVFVTNIAVEGVVIYEAEGVVPVSVLLSRQRAWEGLGMKPETKEWVEKAERDLASAYWQMRALDPNWDPIAFLAQQCVEKYLKAFLEEHNILFPKTHDLTELLKSDRRGVVRIGLLSPRFETIVRFRCPAPRYPGTRTLRWDAEEAIRIAEQVRKVVRAKLNLP